VPSEQAGEVDGKAPTGHPRRRIRFDGGAFMDERQRDSVTERGKSPLAAIVRNRLVLREVNDRIAEFAREWNER
jgi:hypothetical protein